MIRIHSNENRKTGKAIGKITMATIVTMVLAMLITPANGTYNITKPPSSLYIEHLGHAQIDTGTLRIEVQLDKAELKGYGQYGNIRRE